MTTETLPTTVYLVVGARSKVHRGARFGEDPIRFPIGCNVDSVAPDDREEITADEARDIVNREPERRCRRCFWR